MPKLNLVSTSNPLSTYVEWDQKMKFGEQTGIRISADETNKTYIKLDCVVRSRFASFIGFLAEKFGFSNYVNYGMHQIKSSPIHIEKDWYSAAISQVKKFLLSKHEPITSDSANKCLNDVIAKTRAIQSQIILNPTLDDAIIQQKKIVEVENEQMASLPQVPATISQPLPIDTPVSDVDQDVSPAQKNKEEIEQALPLSSSQTVRPQFKPVLGSKDDNQILKTKKQFLIQSKEEGDKPSQPVSEETFSNWKTKNINYVTPPAKKPDTLTVPKEQDVAAAATPIPEKVSTSTKEQDVAAAATPLSNEIPTPLPSTSSPKIVPPLTTTTPLAGRVSVPKNSGKSWLKTLMVIGGLLTSLGGAAFIFGTKSPVISNPNGSFSDETPVFAPNESLFSDETPVPLVNDSLFSNETYLLPADQELPAGLNQGNPPPLGEQRVINITSIVKEYAKDVSNNDTDIGGSEESDNDIDIDVSEESDMDPADRVLRDDLPKISVGNQESRQHALMLYQYAKEASEKRIEARKKEIEQSKTSNQKNALTDNDDPLSQEQPDNLGQSQDKDQFPPIEKAPDYVFNKPGTPSLNVTSNAQKSITPPPPSSPVIQATSSITPPQGNTQISPVISQQDSDFFCKSTDAPPIDTTNQTIIIDQPRNSRAEQPKPIDQPSESADQSSELTAKHSESADEPPESRFSQRIKSSQPSNLEQAIAATLFSLALRSEEVAKKGLHCTSVSDSNKTNFYVKYDIEIKRLRTELEIQMPKDLKFRDLGKELRSLSILLSGYELKNIKLITDNPGEVYYNYIRTLFNKILSNKLIKEDSSFNFFGYSKFIFKELYELSRWVTVYNHGLFSQPQYITKGTLQPDEYRSKMIGLTLLMGAKCLLNQTSITDGSLFDFGIGNIHQSNSNNQSLDLNGLFSGFIDYNKNISFDDIIQMMKELFEIDENTATFLAAQWLVKDPRSSLNGDYSLNNNFSTFFNLPEKEMPESYKNFCKIARLSLISKLIQPASTNKEITSWLLKNKDVFQEIVKDIFLTGNKQSRYYNLILIQNMYDLNQIITSFSSSIDSSNRETYLEIAKTWINTIKEHESPTKKHESPKPQKRISSGLWDDFPEKLRPHLDRHFLPTNEQQDLGLLYVDSSDRSLDIKKSLKDGTPPESPDLIVQHKIDFIRNRLESFIKENDVDSINLSSPGSLDLKENPPNSRNQ